MIARYGFIATPILFDEPCGAFTTSRIPPTGVSHSFAIFPSGGTVGYFTESPRHYQKLHFLCLRRVLVAREYKIYEIPALMQLLTSIYGH